MRRSGRGFVAAWALMSLVAGASGASGAPAPALLHADTVDIDVPDELVRDWDAVEQLSGVDLSSLARKAGLSPAAVDALPPLPDALVRALRDSIVIRDGGVQAAAAADEEAAVEDAPEPFASTRAVSDVTGDGVTDLWLNSGMTGQSARTSLIDGATGTSVWRQPVGLVRPTVIPDVNHDGVRDLVSGSATFVSVRDIEDFEGEDRESGFEFTFDTTMAMLSGANGEQLWSETGRETFGLAFFGRYSTTEYSFGGKVWLDNALLGEALVRRSGPDQLIVQRVDQRASAQSGGRGAYVWNDEPYLSGVRATDTAKVTFTGATRARLVDAASGSTDKTFARPSGEGVAFLFAANDTGASTSDVLWVSFDLPEQRFECVEGQCLEYVAGNRSTTIEAYGAGGEQQWQKQYTGRHATDVWYGDDQTGDGTHDLLLVELLPTDDGYDLQLASLRGANGAEQWRTSLGQSGFGVLAVLARAGGASVIVLDEIVSGARQFAWRVGRVDAGTGVAGIVTTHAVEFLPASDRLPTDETPYVWATNSGLSLQLGGDTDGDGVDDLLVSARQVRHWSDDREPTMWGAWTVESSATGAAVHSRTHTDPLRLLLPWADTSGDGFAEFLEFETASDSFKVLDGRTADPLWELDGDDEVDPVADFSRDGVIDMVSVTGKGAQGHVVRALDGPTRSVLWALDVPPE